MGNAERRRFMPSRPRRDVRVGFFCGRRTEPSVSDQTSPSSKPDIGYVGEDEWAGLVRRLYGAIDAHMAKRGNDPDKNWAEGARALTAITQSVGRLRTIQTQCRTQDNQEDQEDEQDTGPSAEELRAEIESRFARLTGEDGADRDTE